MSNDKPKPGDPQQEERSARSGGKDDPLTSFDPQADHGSETRQVARDEAGPAGTAPTERPAEGNGSVRTAPSGAEGAEAGRRPSGEDAGSDEETAPGEADAAAELERARQEAAAHYERFLRTQAELENYKKRIAKEHAESLRYALTPMVTEVAAILDNLERAVEHARKEPENGGALLEGIEMVLKQMRESLARFGVTRIESVGKPFDPALHEAMMVVERNDVPANQVLDEFQAGYLLHDRVIRPARVSVSKAAVEGAGEQGEGSPSQGG